MHDQLRHDLDGVIDEMTDAERLELAERLVHSVRIRDEGRTERELAAEQKQAIAELLNEIQSLPIADEPDDGLVGSRDHDRILYGRSRKVGSPEKPAK